MMNLGDLVKHPLQRQQQPSTLTPTTATTITSTAKDQETDVKFALGLLDCSGGNGLCRDVDLSRQDQVRLSCALVKLL